MKCTAMALVVVLLLATVACTFDQVLSDLDVLAQTANVVCSTIGSLDPHDAAACTKIATLASQGITVIQTDYQVWKQNPNTSNLQAVVNAINVLQLNLPAELQAANIVDPNTVKVITAWIRLVTSTLNVVLQLLPQTTNAKQLGAKAKAAQLPTPSSLQARWLHEVCFEQASCGARVQAHQLH